MNIEDSPLGSPTSLTLCSVIVHLVFFYQAANWEHGRIRLLIARVKSALGGLSELIEEDIQKQNNFTELWRYKNSLNTPMQIDQTCKFLIGNRQQATLNHYLLFSLFFQILHNTFGK